MQVKSELYEPEKQSIKLAQKLREGNYKKIVLVSWHGAGDQCMLRAPIKKLREMFPDIVIDVAVCKGLDQKFIIPEAIEVGGDWRETLQKEYNLVVQMNMPVERLEDLTMTKAEVCCEKELGIPLTSGHVAIKSKKLVGVHFHNTSVSWLANTDEPIAKKIWQEIIDAGCVPIETLFQHAFYNDTSKKFDFVDNHVRNWPARLDTLIALLSHCDFFIGAVSGNFHLALSILPYTKVCLLEKDLKAPHFTKLGIKRINVKEYQDGVIKQWLATL
jgi:hypothetical protein